MRKFDIIIVGAGPSGIFTALELLERKTNKNIMLIEKGKPVEQRKCLINEVGKCLNCQPHCSITTGFSGAGAFSDGKLTLSNPDSKANSTGGNLPEYLGYEETNKLINYTDGIYLRYGAESKVEGLNFPEKVEGIKKKAAAAGLELVESPIRHLGTEKAREIYKRIQDYLLASNVVVELNTEVTDLLIEGGKVKGVKTYKPRKAIEETLFADTVVVSVGRKGANWLQEICLKHGIEHRAGVVDIGVRVEVKNEVMAEINETMYEGKFVGYLPPYKDKVRVFCQNPSGVVSAERYDDLVTVNGHAFKDKKTENTNLAILSSHRFSVPFNKPIVYGQRIAELANMLGTDQILVQRFGDILKGKRTWDHELRSSKVRSTLTSAVAGDVTSAIPYRQMTNIINFIKAMDMVAPGFADYDTLIYAPEIKFYSNEVVVDKTFQTNIKGLYAIGDGSGLTRGLMMASCSGVYLARVLSDRD